MSRIIVKNLPNGVKEDRVRSLFSQAGTITDCSLKFTKDGVFRKFAFIGYSNPSEAQEAVKHFHKSFIDTSRLTVEYAQDITSLDKDKAWSKYTKMKSALNKIPNLQTPNPTSPCDTVVSKKGGTLSSLVTLPNNLKNEPEFQQFLELHKNKSLKAIWVNDDYNGSLTADSTQTTMQSSSAEISSSTLAYAFDGESDSDDDASTATRGGIAAPGSEGKTISGDLHQVRTTAASNSEFVKSAHFINSVSDLEYMRSKMSSNHLSTDDEADCEDVGENENTAITDNIAGPKSLLKSKLVSACNKMDSKGGNEANCKGCSEVDCKFCNKELFTVKIRRLPHNAREKQIIEFITPLVPAKVGIPRNSSGQTIGIAFVSFIHEKDAEQCVRKTRSYLGSNKVLITAVKSKEDIAAAMTTTMSSTSMKARPWELKGDLQGCETIGESGQLYVRNLAYMCKEEDLEQLFSKYGLLTEVNLPIDKLTKKIKGFAHVTFVLPENAVRAFSELDGTTFQGRILHILPGKPLSGDGTQNDEADSGSGYKKTKERAQKKSASSSHNWNALFLGGNAVADLMAEKYGIQKSQILDADTTQSLGVRMALGETQIVAETRDFLLANGVVLDCFSQPAGVRSKTVILVKNLPASTAPADISAAFGKFGSLGHVLLPPHGVTAIVEFLEPSEAKSAFTHLAYTRFKDLPLYLEWAPTNIFSPANMLSMQERKDEKSSDSSEEDSISTSLAAAGCTVFVKNLSQSTTDKDLAEHFVSCGKIRKTQVALKKDVVNVGKLVSMGYGFVEFAAVQSAQTALKEKQHSVLNGQTLQLKISERTSMPVKSSRKVQQLEKARSATRTTKILVRNIPFEAKRKEIVELFQVFGELKYVRLPKKVSGTGSHRGFAFVDFLTRADAKKAFAALCHSTHLYGRRLVLEWAETESSVDDLRQKTADHYHEDDKRTKKLKKQNLIDDLNSSATSASGGQWKEEQD